MQIVVAASDEQWKELTGNRTNINWQRVNSAADFSEHTNADACFSLKENSFIAEFESLKKPVFINSVVRTLADYDAPANVYRINGWATFLNRTVWEIAGNVDENIKSIFESIGIKINIVPDEPGFITARIIAMIINEAFFAIEDNVSSKTEIDTAMKLGTNYPFGPFEWADLIGTDNISALLQKLNQSDSRYQPSEQLIKEVNNN